jgi:hypothetical protein
MNRVHLAPDVYPPRPPLRIDPAPPTADYLAAREAVAMPTSGPEILSAGCPWCHVPAYRRCVNVGTGRDTDPHYARQGAAGIERPSIRLQELARKQVDESRRARQVV